MGEEAGAAEETDTGKTAAPDAPAEFDGGIEDLRKLIREEMALAEKRRREEMRKRWRAEEWEKEEFGSYARLVHSTGSRLGLTDDQKRQYYNVIKEHYERRTNLWAELQNSHPDAGPAELSGIYRERMKEATKSARERVMEFLTDEQRKKYEELCEASDWFL